MIEIDGSALEGGGQIVRTAIAMSCITGKPFMITGIRKSRPSPGLKQQHLVGLQSAAMLYSASVEGGTIGSMGFSFSPGKPNPKDMKIDVGTAGSIALVMQTLLPVCISMKKTMTMEITGGTHVEWSPPMDYFQRVLVPVLGKMGADVKVQTDSYGFYPKGGGKAVFKTTPCDTLRPVLLEEPALNAKIHAISIASEMLRKAKVAERQLDGARSMLSVDGSASYVPSISPGSCIHLDAVGDGYAMGSSCLGQAGRPAEGVGKSAAVELKKAIDSGSSADEYLADQLIPYMAIADGPSRVLCPAMSRHTETSIWVVKKFVDTDFRVEKRGSSVLISCSGRP